MKLLATSAALCAGLLLAGCANDPVIAAAPAMPPPTSVADADQRLVAVAAERSAIEARFVERERACYAKFFVTRCLDEAKERHRTALAAQRMIEVDAERFKRQAKVEERDRAMAEAEAKYREDEARMAAQTPPPPRAVTEAPPPRPSPVTERVARHNAKLKQEEQKEAADAGRRAANVRAYEQRKKDADERQRKVKERQEEKRAKDAKKAEKPETQQQPAT